MTFYEKAWKERVSVEDKTLLEQTVAARAALQQQRTGTPSVTSSVRVKVDQQVRELIQSKKKDDVAAPVGTSIRSTAGDKMSTAPTAQSSRSTQPSHRGASTVGGSTSVISELTAFSTRLAKMEERLDEERTERRKVHEELAEIKKLLLQRQKQK